jgi:hypothetical protein
MEKKFFQIFLISVALGAVLFLQVGFSGAEEPKPLPSKSLVTPVEKIMQQSCATSGCHQGAFAKKKLNLESAKFLAALVDRPSLQAEKYKLVDTENPQKSYLLIKVRGDSGMVESRMPIEAPPLQAEEIKALEDWVYSLKKATVKTEKALPGEAVKKK